MTLSNQNWPDDIWPRRPGSSKIATLKDKNPGRIDGKTPLHVAAERGNYQICQLFVETICDKSPKNNQGITPFDLAYKNGHNQVSQLIMEACFPNGVCPGMEFSEV